MLIHIISVFFALLFINNLRAPNIWGRTLSHIFQFEAAPNLGEKYFKSPLSSPTASSHF